MENTNPQSVKSRRGFAAMTPEKQKEIAQKGGRAAHEKGVAHHVLVSSKNASRVS